MPNPFAIQTVRQDGVSIITLEGFVDAHTAPEFERVVQAEIDAGHYRFIVNCEKLTYISSAGLGVFMSFVEEVRDQSGDIKICGLTPKVRQTFDILGFQSLFEMLEDVTAATRRFAEAQAKEG